MLMAVETSDWERAAKSSIIQDGQDGSGTTLYGPKLSQDHIAKVTRTAFVSHYG